MQTLLGIMPFEMAICINLLFDIVGRCTQAPSTVDYKLSFIEVSSSGGSKHQYGTCNLLPLAHTPSGDCFFGSALHRRPEGCIKISSASGKLRSKKTGAHRVTPDFVGEEAGGHEASEMYFSSFGLAI